MSSVPVPSLIFPAIDPVTGEIFDVPPAGSALGNAAEFTVSTLSSALKRTLEDGYGHVRVRGEISRVSTPQSGHVYFDLKDENASLACVVWRGVISRLSSPPKAGLDVILGGKITTFPGQSKYQLVVDSLEHAGEGALMALLQERRARLQREGLFDPARKKPLPLLPTVIGVVTSPSGAVIRDILHRLADRFPRRVLIWPVRVQGETCAREVCAAISGFNALPQGGPIPRPDVLIVARGGGSFEDLWGFQDEAVARAAASSAIPLISAIGHETDFTLLDDVADRRAPTPSAAAEMAVPVRQALLDTVSVCGGRMDRAWARTQSERRNRVTISSQKLPNFSDFLAFAWQKSDALFSRFLKALTINVQTQRLGFLKVSAHLSPSRLKEGMALRRDRMVHLDERGKKTIRYVLERRKERLKTLGQLLDAFSYRGVLKRGFVLARTEEGAPLRSVLALDPGATVTLEFHDGRAEATIKEHRAMGRDEHGKKA